MHRYAGIISAIFAGLGFISIAAMFWGHAQNDGMAAAAFQLWGIVSSTAAIVLGFIARWMAKQAKGRISRASDFGMGLGLGCMLALLIAMLFLS